MQFNKALIAAAVLFSTTAVLAQAPTTGKSTMEPTMGKSTIKKTASVRI